MPATVRMTAAEAKRLKGSPFVPAKPKTPTARHVVSVRPYSAVTLACFEFPLPPTACSPNNHDHGRIAGIVVGKARAAYRAECLGLLPPINYHAWGRMFEKANIEAEFFLGAAPGRYHPRDEQNASASIKALVDSLVEAGYLIDDSAKYLHWESVELIRPSKLACVRITLSRVTK